jgi:hypothetical protein
MAIVAAGSRGLPHPRRAINNRLPEEIDGLPQNPARRPPRAIAFAPSRSASTTRSFDHALIVGVKASDQPRVVRHGDVTDVSSVPVHTFTVLQLAGLAVVRVKAAFDQLDPAPDCRVGQSNCLQHGLRSRRDACTPGGIKTTRPTRSPLDAHTAVPWARKRLLARCGHCGESPWCCPNSVSMPGVRPSTSGPDTGDELAAEELACRRRSAEPSDELLDWKLPSCLPPSGVRSARCDCGAGYP